MEGARACVVGLSVMSATAIFILYASQYTTVPAFLLSVSGKSSTGRGCVLVLRYSGQQAAGVAALASLQRWVKDIRLPTMIVEPFFQKSVMGNRRIRSSPSLSARFSDMFDLDHFNKVSRSEGVPEIIDWPTYITSRPRKAVLVEMVLSKQASAEPPVVTWSAATRDECSLKTIANPMNNTDISLCVVRRIKGYWKFGSKYILSADVVYNTVLDGLDPTELTLIFSLWRGPWQINTLPHSNDHSITDNMVHGTAKEGKFQDSPKLHLLADNYRKRFLTLNTTHMAYVAVMLRTEHSVLELRRVKNANVTAKLDECMQEVLQTTRMAMKTVGSSNLLVTADVGYYGSGSWNQTLSWGRKGNMSVLQQRVERAVERLYDGRMSFQQWEQSFSLATGGVEDRGYVAALQRVLASEASCLVLLGGGLFQQLTLEKYLQRNHTHCVHLVCMEKKYSVSFQSMLKKLGAS